MTETQYQNQRVRILNDDRYPPSLKEWALAMLEIEYMDVDADERERLKQESEEAQRVRLGR